MKISKRALKRLKNKQKETRVWVERKQNNQ